MSTTYCDACELVVEGEALTCGECGLMTCPHCHEVTIELQEDDEQLIAKHDPSTTIVEKVDITPEFKKAFEDAGYTIEDNT